jgi:hypothetical protein
MGRQMIIILLFTFIFAGSCISEEGDPCRNDWECPEGQYCNMDNPVYDEMEMDWFGECHFKIDCSEDPTVCPNGYKCINGYCEKDSGGDTGNTGNTGNTGDTGDTGDTGNTGDTGDTGDTGNTGDTGDTGNSGNTGDTGEPDDEVVDTDHPDEEYFDEDFTDEEDFDEDFPDEDIADEDIIEPETIFHFSFDDGKEGWTHDKIDNPSNSWNYDMWAQGAPSSVGPSTCYEGTGCFGFNLTGNYINCNRAQLISPVIDLNSHTGEDLQLSFWHWHNFWASPTSWYDGGFVEFSSNGGTNWNQITGAGYPGTVKIKTDASTFLNPCECDSATFYAHNKPGFIQTTGGNWQQVSIDIPSEMIAENFRIRFVFSSGVQSCTTSSNPTNYSHAGWYIDEVRIQEK